MPEIALGVRSSRPMLRIEGQAYPQLDAALLELAVREGSEGMASAEITLSAWGTRQGGPDYTLFDRKQIEFGKKIEVLLGNAKVFAGRIMAIEASYPSSGAGEARVCVLAEDRLQDMRMTRRTRSFEHLSDADVMQRIASDHGLRAQIDLTGPTHNVLTQVNQSDLAFLRDRARTLGAEIWVDDDALHVGLRPGRDRGTALALKYGSSLREMSLRADLAHQRSSLRVTGWSPQDKRAIDERADSSVLASELGSGESGIAVLERTLGAREDTVAHLSPGSADEARAIAQAWLRQIGRRFVCGNGVAQPEPSLRAGRRVNLSGLGALFDGDYTVTEVCHRFSTAAGLSTELCVESPAIGRP